MGQHSNPISLRLVAPDLVARLQRASEGELRRVAAAVSSLAVTKAELSHEDVRAVFLNPERTPDQWQHLRERIDRLVQELDERAWRAKQEVEAGRAPNEAYLRAFRMARAAAAVGNMLSADALDAASEAAYEAYFAIDDRTVFREAIRRALGERPSA
jgi:hypothetical protein